MIVAVAMTLILVSTVLYILKEYNRKAIDVAKAKPDFEVTDTTLMSEFEKDEKSAIEKYSRRIIRVDGTIREIEKSNNTYSFNLGLPSSLSAVHCVIDSTQDAGNQHEGSRISLKGVLVGFNKDEVLGSDVVLNRCILLFNK